MIASFGDRATASLFHGRRPRDYTEIPSEIRRVALRKLDMLNSAAKLDDLRSPPGNRLELLRGKLAGSYSIRINEQWLIVFYWRDADAHQVRIVDYH